MANLCLFSLAGSNGKSTIAAHGCSPRMPGASFFAVETVNETAGSLGVDVEKIDGERFSTLYKQLLAADGAIIDVGASNAEEFMNGLVKFDGVQAEIDRFVIPVLAGTREFKEAIRAVRTLAGLGVSQDRIRIVFNRAGDDVEEQFAPLVSFSQKERLCMASPQLAVFENEVYDMLAAKRLTMAAALADQHDYRAELRSMRREDDPKRYAHVGDMLVIQALARAANRNLDRVFALIME